MCCIHMCKIIQLFSFSVFIHVVVPFIRSEAPPTKIIFIGSSKLKKKGIYKLLAYVNWCVHIKFIRLANSVIAFPVFDCLLELSIWNNFEIIIANQRIYEEKVSNFFEFFNYCPLIVCYKTIKCYRILIFYLMK